MKTETKEDTILISHKIEMDNGNIVNDNYHIRLSRSSMQYMILKPSEFEELRVKLLLFKE